MVLVEGVEQASRMDHLVDETGRRGCRELRKLCHSAAEMRKFDPSAERGEWHLIGGRRDRKVIKVDKCDQIGLFPGMEPKDQELSNQDLDQDQILDQEPRINQDFSASKGCTSNGMWWTRGNLE